MAGEGEKIGKALVNSYKRILTTATTIMNKCYYLTASDCHTVTKITFLTAMLYNIYALMIFVYTYNGRQVTKNMK